MTSSRERNIIVREGLAKLLVPNPSLYTRPDGRVEPAWMPVFYNPAAKLSRDITVLAARAAFGGKSFFFVDLLAGTGARGVRLGLEAGGEGIANDVDPRAFHFIRENLRLNGLVGSVEAYNTEANALSNLLTFSGTAVDFMDVDPYGSPSVYIDSALKPLGKNSILAITATDTGPLTCSHSSKALKRYWIECVDVDFDKELAARTLIYNTVIRASALDRLAEPLITLYREHYIRVVFRVSRANPYRRAKECRGFVWYCPDTLERGFTGDPLEAPACSSGQRPKLLGPLWTCGLGDPEFIAKMEGELPSVGWLDAARLGSLLALIREESTIRGVYVRVDLLSRAAKANMPKLSALVESLKAHGFHAARTHMDPRGVRSDAPVELIRQLIIELGRSAA